MAFISDNEKVPVKEGKYMKLKVGENRFRVLGGKISGWEGWKTQDDGAKRPVRCTEDGEIGLDSVDDPNDIKHFWAFPVWNYDAKRVQILKLTQSGVKQAILALGKNPKWGDPTEYDLVISAIGEGLEREYTVQPDPKEVLKPDAQKVWDAIKGTLNMEVFFQNGDPFGEEK